MLLTLRLRNFRCYPTLNWDIPAEGALLYGDNAQGKTSLLEAICFALTLHTPRTSRMDRMAMLGTEEFGISLDTDEGTRRLYWSNKKLNMQVNGASKKDFTDYLTVDSIAHAGRYYPMESAAGANSHPLERIR